MAIASSTSSRRQCSSHGAGQTRPSTLGNGIVRLKIRVLSRQFGLGVGLEEARDVDVAGALVLARRQAVGVVVAEDQLEVRPAQAADLLGLGLDLHLRLARARAARSADAPRPRPRRRTSGTPRSPAAWARSRGSGSRCRCRGRPRGSSGPRSPRRRGRRPRSGCAATTAGAAATACRAGARRANPAFGRRGRLSGRVIRSAMGRLIGSHRRPPRSGGRRRQGRRCAGVLVQLGPEVSHPAGQREGRQALVVAQRGRRRCRPTGRSSSGRVGRAAAGPRRRGRRSRPAAACRSGTGSSCRTPRSAQNRVSSRPGRRRTRRSSATTTEPEPMWAPAARSASKSYGVSSSVRRQQPAGRAADQDRLDRAAGRQLARRARRPRAAACPSGTSAMPSPAGRPDLDQDRARAVGRADRRERRRRRCG